MPSSTCVSKGFYIPSSSVNSCLQVGTMSTPEGCPESDPLELTCSEVECEEEDVPVLESPLSEDFKRFKRLIDLNK